MAKKPAKGAKGKTAARKKAAKRGSQKKPGTTRKDATSNSGLQKQYFSRVKQEYHDIDYADKLNPKDRAWLASFMDEDLGARFNHHGKRVYKKKRDVNASYNRNNARNRDQYGIAKATGTAVDVPLDQAYQYWEENYIDPDFESKVLESIDGETKAPILSLDEYAKLKDQMVPEVKDFYVRHYGLQESLENAELMQGEDQGTEEA